MSQEKEIKKLLQDAVYKVNQATQLVDTICEPAPTTILGVNMGKEYDQVAGNHPIIRYGIKHVRVFLLLEEAYRGMFPSMYDPHYDPNDLNNWNYSMMGYRNRFRQMKEQGLDIRVSLESIFVKDDKGKILHTRKFPNKSFSREQWGDTKVKIKANAKKLAVAIEHMYGEFISCLEFTNEAWGEPGTEATQWIIKGLVEGFEATGSSIKLSLGAYQAYAPNNRWDCKHCSYPTGDYIGHVFQPWMTNHIDEITIHPYSFELGTLKLTEPPDSPDSEFKYIDDMIKWRDDHYPSLKISITEIGWNSALPLNEDIQAQYLDQALQIAQQKGIHAMYVYEAVEDPNTPLYSTCGLFTIEGNRKPDKAKKFLKDRLKKKP